MKTAASGTWFAAALLAGGAALMAAGGADGVDVSTGGEVGFAGDHYLVAAIRDQPTQDLLGASVLIHVRAVKDVNAHIAAAAEHRFRSLLVGLTAERPGAHTQFRDLDARVPQETILHVPSPFL